VSKPELTCPTGLCNEFFRLRPIRVIRDT
jgi:hypothetical protein